MAKRKKYKYTDPKTYTQVDNPKTSNIVEGTKTYQKGLLTIMVSPEPEGWHMSIAHPERFPTWAEIKQARYILLPDEITMAQLLPPAAEYVNLHNNCFHLWEVSPDERALIT